MKRKISEEDSSGGTELQAGNNEQDGSAKSNKKSKLGDRDFTSQEISKLKETEALYHSSLFRLQMSELLKEISIKQKMKNRLDEVCTFLTDTLKGLAKGKEHKITDRKWLDSKGIKIPVVEKPGHVKGTFQFLPPVDVNPSGSFVLDTFVMPGIQTDLVLVIPKEFFQPKDYLNQRYTRKRALYLCAVASHLSKVKRVEDLKFTYYMGNPLKPVLVATVKGHDGKNVQVRLQTVPESDSFKLSRFHVSKNNVRPSWFLEKGETSNDNADNESLPPTPYYNSTVLHDLCLVSNQKFVEKLLSGSDGVRDGIKLLKVWLHQRELLTGCGAFSSFLMCCYVVYLIMTRKISKLMNSYQVFRTTLLYLSKSDWVDDPPSLFEDDAQKMQPSTDEFKEAASCVFPDRTGYYNLAYALPSYTYERVKHEAQISLEALEKHNQSSFDAMFMTPVSFAHKFDHIFHLNLKGDLLRQPLQKVEGLQNQVMDVGGSMCIPLTQQIVKVLAEALGKRAVLIQPNLRTPKEWSTSEKASELDSSFSYTFGICLDTANAFSILDKGPPAESVDSREFRQFWGEKSEMRRFKDGTIHEAVLWTESTCQSERRLVCKRVVQHVLQRHCGIPGRCVDYMEGKLDPLLHLNLLPKDVHSVYGTGEEQSLDVHHAFNHVARAVRLLSSLPLSIHSIQGIHPVFRHASVFPPLPASTYLADVDVVSDGVAVPKEKRPLPQYVPAMEVICMLEGSGKWPEEIEAIKCLKSLLHVKMGTELKEKHHMPTSVSKGYVDVLKDRYVFRLIIANTRELAVLRTVKTESGMVKFKDTDKCLALEKEIIELPKLTHLLHGVQQENPVFSVTVRLCKRWVAAQLVGGVIADEAVELMVAYLFTSPHPYAVPGSPNAGLLRFLHLLSSFNWKADPLMVNLNKEFKDDDYTTIVKEFQKNRTSLPCMCICTPSDKQGTKWTKHLPTEFFLQRLVVLARESMLALDSQIMKTCGVADFKMIFRPPLHHFDLVIHLLKKANVVHHQGIDEKKDVAVKPTPAKLKGAAVFPVVNFCPISKLVEDLQNVFEDFAMFFYDPFGGDVIGMVWKPLAHENKDYKPINFRYRKPLVDESEKASLEVIKDVILDDIRVMGDGIVKLIEAPKSKQS